MDWRKLEERVAFWERRMGAAPHFNTAAAARVAMKSQRTIQRHIALGRLHAVGGSDRSIEHARILRAELLRYLLERDSLVRVSGLELRRYLQEREQLARA